MNDFICDVQCDDQAYADYLEMQQLESFELQVDDEELRAWYDSHRVIDSDTLDDMYDTSMPSMYALQNGLV